MSFLIELLQSEQLTQIVDIGANPIDGDPPYQKMLQNKQCQLIGFEPQEQALRALLLSKTELETYLPYVIADGSVQQLHICRGSGMTSLLEPNHAVLSVFDAFLPFAEVIKTTRLQTKRLDDVTEVRHIDFLKIDIQGSELQVFQSGREKLKTAVVIQTEVSFMTLYQNQPGFGEVDIELRAQGFVPHAFAAVKKWPIAPMVVNNHPAHALNQLLEADLVYVRDFSQPDAMSDEQLKQLAIIAHEVYQSWDLTLRCLMLLQQRDAQQYVDVQQRYVDYLSMSLNNEPK